MRVRNLITSILLLVSLLVLAALGAQAQSENTLLAETSTAVVKPAQAESFAKTKATSFSETKASETQAQTKVLPAPPLASVPEAPPQELPFKLNDRPELATETPSASGMLLRTFGALLLIVACIAAASWGLRYFGFAKFGKQQGETSGLKVLDTVPLGERRTLTLVRFGERTLLIGSTPQGLTLLAEQADEAEPENYRPTVRTVTDLLDVDAQPPFEQELARASLINTTWSERRVQ